jgi:cytoskeletal protein RodZ
MNSFLEVLQERRLEEIGHYLRQVRKERNLTLNQISQGIKVQVEYLNAIETGTLKQLPATAREVRRFIKLYADSLKLNGRELALTFPTQVTNQLLPR